MLQINANASATVTGSMRSVFVQLLVHGPLSRAETARRLELSPSALTKLTKPLIEEGYLLEQPSSGTTVVGRPSQPLAVDPDRACFVGVKLTAEDLYAVRTNLVAAIEAEVRLNLIDHSVDAIVSRIAEAVRRLTPTRGSISGVGLSLAGTATPGDPVVHTSPFLGWRQVPLAELVEAAVGLPVVLENDVRALTAAQQWFGAGVGHSSFALITVGAGIGCGLVIDDHLTAGANRATGLVGHLFIDGSGPLCEQGHRGCARAYASASAVRRSVAYALGRPELTFDECVALARDGEPVARRVIDDAARALGQLAATVANMTGPEVVILSGEGVDMVDVGMQAFQAALAAHTHWTTTPVDVVVRPFAFSEWARGAAVAALQHQLLGR